uniref:Uncharacterized protein n=1 Tax=Anguilla anguilla TaxID=7936 RepID=A0A0E9V1D7_ANGAN
MGTFSWQHITRWAIQTYVCPINILYACG